VTDVVIVDTGGANLASVQYAFERLGARARVSDHAHTISDASHVVLPGVGSANSAMQRLTSRGLPSVILALTRPVLGICLGMQLLFSRSEEGDTACLGLLPDTVRRLKSTPSRPVPHMGWNQLESPREDSLLEGICDRDYMYFVHSYAAPVGDTTLASATYGGTMSAVVRHQNFYGTQFHPERSGGSGARLLGNFLRL
jgi:imidazole glycerol-phosphate synthase subunit HisH